MTFDSILRMSYIVFVQCYLPSLVPSGGLVNVARLLICHAATQVHVGVCTCCHGKANDASKVLRSMYQQKADKYYHRTG